MSTPTFSSKKVYKQKRYTWHIHAFCSSHPYPAPEKFTDGLVQIKRLVPVRIVGGGWCPCGYVNVYTYENFWGKNLYEATLCILTINQQVLTIITIGNLILSSNGSSRTTNWREKKQFGYKISDTNSKQ